MSSLGDPKIAHDANTMCAHARTFYEHGWLMGTSGNLSIRQSPSSFLITASGKDKGQLTPEDFLICDLEGQPTEPTPHKPSAETLLHCAIYERYPEAGAIYHTHDPFAALCSSRDAHTGHTTVSDVEMIKGLNLWTQGASIQIPILPNPADLKLLSAHVRQHLEQRDHDAQWQIPCVNILRHGVYAWGKDAQEAKRHMESLAYLLHYSWQWGLYTKH